MKIIFYNQIKLCPLKFLILLFYVLECNTVSSYSSNSLALNNITGKSKLSKFPPYSIFPLLPLPPSPFHSISPDSTKKIKSKKIFFLSSLGASYVGGLFFLNHVWYAEHRTTGFHFFNDANEWNYMDKTGHWFFTYQISRAGNLWFRQAGFDEKNSLWWGGFLGAILLTPIEIFDGYSSGYGASGWDVLSNIGGSAWFISQEFLFKKQIVEIKFSFRNSAYSTLRPEVLGRTTAERIIKDYNGQTYWFCLNVGNLSGEKKESILNSLGIALGYGAEGMIYGNNELNPGSFKKIYIAPDINLTKLPVRNATLKKILFYLNFYHLPLPALEYNRKMGWVWLWSQ